MPCGPPVFFFFWRGSLGGAGTIWQPLTWCYSVYIAFLGCLSVCLRAVRVCVQCVCLCLCMCVCVMWSVCTRERGRECPEPKAVNNPFVDVKPTDFFYKAVLWAVECGITNGVDATHFGPTAGCNRAQVVTFLYRAYN